MQGGYSVSGSIPLSNPGSIRVSAEGESDLAQVQRWIVLNRAAILDHWHGRTDGAELAQVLRRLPA